MKQTGAVTLLTLGLILWVHQLSTIGGRVPLIFVVAWFGAAAIVALIFARPAVWLLDAAPMGHRRFVRLHERGLPTSAPARGAAHPAPE